LGKVFWTLENPICPCKIYSIQSILKEIFQQKVVYHFNLSIQIYALKLDLREISQILNYKSSSKRDFCADDVIIIFLNILCESSALGSFNICRHSVYAMQKEPCARTNKRYRDGLLDVEEQARARLGSVWPEFLQCRARATGECFCGVKRDVKLWMLMHGSLVLVELDAYKHMQCTRGRDAERYWPMARAFGGLVVVVRLHWSGRGLPLAERLEELVARVGAAAAAAAAGPSPAAARFGSAAAVEVMHVHFARGEPDLRAGAAAGAAGAAAVAAGAAGEAAGAAAGAAVEAAGAAAGGGEGAESEEAACSTESDDEAACPASVCRSCGRAGPKAQRTATFSFEDNLEYFKKKARQGRGFWNPERRRLAYEESGDRARLLEGEAWVLSYACRVEPRLRQKESRFTGFCGCGALRYANVWMETEEPSKTLFLLELDAHEHLRCTQGRERGRYTGLLRHFGGPVFVLRWNPWQGAARAGDAARAVELMTAVTGSLNRIDDGENVGEGNCQLEVLHMGYGGEAANFPAGLRLREEYLGGTAAAGAERPAWMRGFQPSEPPPGAEKGHSYVFTGR